MIFLASPVRAFANDFANNCTTSGKHQPFFAFSKHWLEYTETKDFCVKKIDIATEHKVGRWILRWSISSPLLFCFVLFSFIYKSEILYSHESRILPSFLIGNPSRAVDKVDLYLNFGFPCFLRRVSKVSNGRWLIKEEKKDKIFLWTDFSAGAVENNRKHDELSEGRIHGYKIYRSIKKLLANMIWLANIYEMKRMTAWKTGGCIEDGNMHVGLV